MNLDQPLWFDEVTHACLPVRLLATSFRLVGFAVGVGARCACAACSGTCLLTAAHSPRCHASPQFEDDGGPPVQAFAFTFVSGFTAGNPHEASNYARSFHKVLRRGGHPSAKDGTLPKKPYVTYTGTGGTKYQLQWEGPMLGYSFLKGCVGLPGAVDLIWCECALATECCERTWLCRFSAALPCNRLCLCKQPTSKCPRQLAAPTHHKLSFSIYACHTWPNTICPTHTPTNCRVEEEASTWQQGNRALVVGCGPRSAAYNALGAPFRLLPERKVHVIEHCLATGMIPSLTVSGAVGVRRVGQ